MHAKDCRELSPISYVLRQTFIIIVVVVRVKVQGATLFFLSFVFLLPQIKKKTLLTLHGLP